MISMIPLISKNPSVNPVNAILLLPHRSMHIEIHGSPNGSMPQDGGHGLAVSAVFQAGRGEAMAHSVEVAVLHLAALQNRLEPLLHIPGLRTGIPPGQHIKLIPFPHAPQHIYKIPGNGNLPGRSVGLRRPDIENRLRLPF